MSASIWNPNNSLTVSTGKIINVKDYPYLAKGDGVTDDTTAIQAAINAAYGGTVYFPNSGGGYRTTAPLVIQPVFNNATNLPMQLIGDGFDGNGGSGGTFLKIDHAGNGIELINSNPFNAEARFIFEGFGIIGDGLNIAGGNNIHAVKVSNLILRNLWVQGARNDNIYFERCYGSAVEDCTLVRGRRWNFYADKAFNLGDLHRIKAYGGGRFYSSAPAGNIRITGSGDENLGLVLNNVDVSYAGSSAYQLFQISNSSLVSISVTAGVATVTTGPAHGLSTGFVVAVVGATVDPALNTIYPVSVTVLTPNTFTFATAAGNGTYTESSLVIGPASYGLYVDSCRGITIAGYSEDCIGPALYLGASVDSFKVVGGYWQGSNLGGVIINDSALNGSYEAMYINGPYAKLFISTPDGPNNVNYCSSNTFNSGASVTLPTIFMRDGTYYSPTVPTTGTWAAGAYIKRSNPTVGGPKGWYCTVGGTPGTWVSEGNL